MKFAALFLVAAVLPLAGRLEAKDLRVLKPAEQDGVTVNGFWRERYRLLTVKWLPHCVREMEQGGRGQEMLNLVATGEINAGKTPSVKFTGCPWSDAYPYNTVEAICLALEIDPGEDAQWREAQKSLRAKVDEWIPIFLAAQEPSGYIHSYHALHGQKHFSKPWDHEFYVMGYFIEMGVAHMRMTRGKDHRLFDAAKRCADHLDNIFGPEPKRTWYNGHAGIEYAFLRLADACEIWDGPGSGTKYAKLAQFFVRHQHLGGERNPYNQTEKPAVEMTEATGHAVRACYFYSAMTGIGARLGDNELASAADKIYANAIDRKEYLTGGVGAEPQSEAFGKDYDLRQNGYCESCASCGMSFWSTELHALHGSPRPEDVRERLLYNNLLGSISADGENFYYQNPLDQDNMRYPWHGCPCCIGNIPRTLFALKDTLFSVSADGKTLWVDHFMDIENATAEVGGAKIKIRMETGYPDSGKVKLTLTPDRAAAFKVMVRFPDRTESELYYATPEVEHGYRQIAEFSGESGAKSFSFELPMPEQQIRAVDQVEACRGKVAFQRGPIVYSWEGPDHSVKVANADRLNRHGGSRVWIEDLTPDANPVIWADVPDMAVLFHDDTYWMISTSMHLIPSMPIMKSKDLVNWELVNYCMDGALFDDNDEWNLRNGRNEYGFGTWASSLRWHDGYFWATTFDRRRTYIARAKDPAGKWESWKIDRKLHDHSLFFDNASGRVFMFSGAGNCRLTELEPDLKNIKAGGFDREIIRGISAPAGGGLGEGSQAFARNGWYYLVNICWPRGDCRQVVVHRARNIEGPWDDAKVVFKCRGIAQGTIFEGRGGEWHALLFGDRGGVGRIPYAVPVRWEDDWPILGVDGKYLAPLDARHDKDIPAVCASDEFDWNRLDKMPLVWQWNHKPYPDYVSASARKGWLRIAADRTVKQVTEAHNILTQRVFGPECRAEVKLDASGLNDGDTAGLVLLQRDCGYVGIRRENGRFWVVWSGRRDNRDLPEVKIPAGSATVWLRAYCDLRVTSPADDFRRNDTMEFSFSLDGETWNAIGDTLPMPYTIPQFIGYRFGLFEFATREPGGYADFDYYRISNRP
ncbi:MAG: glycoside hydrolase family 127 protein [Kiritimatiellae bacterium]|nr:glycoside hydrolase family 127 protein [Kiritimatiellia bacterium]